MEERKEEKTEAELYDEAFAMMNQSECAKGAEMMQRLAESGYSLAQFQLGRMYYKGNSVIDYVRAVAWYKKAAEQGYAEAQYALGIMYYEGKGVDEDDVKAAEWFEKAARQDHVDAQFKMAYMYEKGIGVEKDSIRAGVWRGILREKGMLISDEY